MIKQNPICWLLKKGILPIFLLVFPLMEVNSQEVYRTLDGHIQVNGEFEKEGFVARSSELVVLVDYESGDLIIRLDPSTLMTNNDSLNKLLVNSLQGEIFFDGNLGTRQIDPEQCTAPGSFPVEGILMVGRYSGWISGSGSLAKRNSNDRIPCVLQMEFMVDKSMFGQEPELKGFHPQFQIEIMQAILQKETY